jgi:curli production assembly/transport component CsgG|tara:strand:- start:2208 stop:2990 length:783 start_codon:yes stop_codon:yes gene_type:complete
MWKLLPMILLLGACATSGQLPRSLDNRAVIQDNPMVTELNELLPLNGPVMTIGIYGFTDKTGQRKPAENIANLSSAVTQGAEVWVIDALLQAGNGTWFEVVERGGMDNLIKERQLIRNTRQNYEGDDATQLDPMKFAGILIEGGIVGYDSNIITGGNGARYFGIGSASEYRVDTVTVAMRLVSVSTGRILVSVAAEKSIASYRQGADVFKFVDLSTKALEIETGYSVNEPTNYATREAIEKAVIELIYAGAHLDLWEFLE